MRICKVKGCNKKHEAKGFCQMHYVRYKIHGSPHIIGNKRTHGMYNTSIYHIWQTMKARCKNPNNTNYKNYGGRGIKVCERWLDFRNFLADMGDRLDEMQIDRINNDGDYTPENCRWVTITDQARNRRNNVLSIEMANHIRLLYKRNYKPKDIAEKLNIQIHNVGDVLYHNHWK